MKTTEMQKLYSDHMEGRLDPALRREFETRLAADPAARADYEQFKRTHRLVGSATPVAADPDLEQRVLARLKGGDAGAASASGAGTSPAQPLTVWLGLAASLALVAVLAAMGLADRRTASIDPGGPDGAAGTRAGSLNDATGGDPAAGESTGSQPSLSPAPAPGMAGPFRDGTARSGDVVLADAELEQKVRDIRALIEQINQASNEYERMRREQEIVLAVGGAGQEQFVLRPADFRGNRRRPETLQDPDATPRTRRASTRRVY